MARTPSPTSETLALPGVSASSFLLHHEDERANQRSGEQQTHALERPDVVRHQHFADSFYGERFDGWRDNRYAGRFQNCPNQSAKDNESDDYAAPIKTARLFVLTTGEQDREDDQDRDGTDINE